MPASRQLLGVSLPVAALLVTACGTTGPVAGAAYGPATATTAASPAASASMSGSPAATASGAPMIGAKTVLTVRKTKIGFVLATSAGLTVYWFSHDVKGSGKSACTGGCLTSWPAVTGQPAAAAGVTLSGKLGTITRPGGVVQATYNGYPLYTYAADMSPGQTTGNGVGGVWHVIMGVELSPAAVAATSSG